MTVVLVYLRLYGRAFADALAALGKNVWTLALPMGLAVALMFLSTALGGLGFLGGILLYVALTATFSVYSFFVGSVVAHERVDLKDFKRSLGAYFWTWMNLFFVLWVVDLLLGLTLSANERRAEILTAVALMKLLVLNATPETIYLKGTWGGLDTIQRSFRFLQENWIEWFIPNGLLLAAVYFGAQRLAGLWGGLGLVVVALGAGAVLHVAMVFRGFLYQALDGSTHRQRMFRYRNG